MNKGNVTQVLEALERGEPVAGERLLPLVYDELRRLASRKMAQESPGHTLQPTALVHEAYMRLVQNGDNRSWENRGHFYAAAAEAMRRILIEGARRKGSHKRGGSGARVDLADDFAVDSGAAPDSLLELDEALQRLEAADSEGYQLVMLRYFGGLTVDEAAAALGVSPRTAKRNWAYARAWLRRELERG